MDEPVTFEQAQAAAGTRSWHDPRAAEKIQARLDANDATLPEALKEQHPVRRLAQIKQDRPNRWVALLPTEVTAGLGVAAGRVFAEAVDRAEIRDQIRTFQQAHPQLRLMAYFARPSSFGSVGDDGSA